MMPASVKRKLGGGADAGSAAAKKAKAPLLAFSKASAFYGSRKGYVFKMGDEGLGYYLDDARLARTRIAEAMEGPGIPLEAPAVDSDSDGDGDGAAAKPAAAANPTPLSAADLPAKPAREKAAFDPYADLPAPAATVARPPQNKPSAAPPSPKKAVRVFAPGLFKLEKVHCLHIVRKHRDSRNPTSWRNPAKRIERSQEVASDEVRAMRAKLLAAPAHSRRSLFEQLAKLKSECGSAKKGGDLGVFRKGKMSPPFEAAAFNLDIRELSRPVASSSGVHLILRVA